MFLKYFVAVDGGAIGTYLTKEGHSADAGKSPPRGLRVEEIFVIPPSLVRTFGCDLFDHFFVC